MKSAAKGLFDAHFEYDDIHEQTGKDANNFIRWVQKIRYINAAGMIELQFTDDVIPLITRLTEQYTEYDLKQVSELQSEYAIRLYELMMQWQSVGKTNQITIDNLRKKLGVKPEQYKQMCNFKTRVLDHAVKQINDYTDITVKYDQHKTGKTITAISFIFKKKQILDPAKNKKRDSATPDLFHKMTDSQVKTFSAKLAALPELGSNAPIGKSTAEFAAIIANDLVDENKQAQYMPYLAKLGYQPKKHKT